jgi:hypothetical protein
VQVSFAPALFQIRTHLEEYNMRKIATALAACGVIATLPASLLAADAPDAAAPAATPPPAPTVPELLGVTGLTMHGYVDAGYSYLSGAGTFTSGAADRFLDTQHNSFGLNQAGLTVALQPAEGWGGLVTLTAGHDAGLIHSYGGDTGNFDVTQAFVQYATGNWTVIGGKFNTLAGAEVINPTGNTNFSRSILNSYEPITHTGLRATYAVDSTLSFIFGVNNGWDQVTDLNSQKTAELGVAWVPNKTFSLLGQAYYGSEPTFGSNNGNRLLVDLVATYAATDSLTLVLNYDYGSQEKTGLPNETIGTATWSGFAAYLNYAIDDNWRISVRGEYFDDADGSRTGLVQKWKEETFTVGYAPTKSVELRGEIRADESDVNAFEKLSSSPSKNQYSLALQGVIKF